EWHVVVLNGMCEEVGGCSPDSPQARWLKADLAESDGMCTLAMVHHPLFTSGDKHGPDPKVKPIYDELHAAGAEAVLSGSEGNYERFAPQDPEGNADPEGVRQFVVGTGGHFLNGFEDVSPNSEARNATDHGVLKLTLNPDGYDWEFVPVEGKTFTDSGSAECRE
ncbi:MAG: metallophosphoesterase family protein, partial [Rubrobacteraceae bacterium]